MILFLAAKRTVLSEAYQCEEAWQRRLDSPFLKHLKMGKQIYLLHYNHPQCFDEVTPFYFSCRMQDNCPRHLNKAQSGDFGHLKNGFKLKLQDFVLDSFFSTSDFQLCYYSIYIDLNLNIKYNNNIFFSFKNQNSIYIMLRGFTILSIKQVFLYISLICDPTLRFFTFKIYKLMQLFSLFLFSEQYFVETDKKFATKRLVSGVDVDLVIYCYLIFPSLSY